jgi:hypothetical protein
MTTPVFPYLPAQGFPVKRSGGNFDTTTQVAMSGKKTTFANRTQATRKYEIVVEGLDSSGYWTGLVANSLQAVEGLFNQCLGSALIFNYWDVDDCQVVAQEFGVGDGVSTKFQLARAAGGWADLIFAPLNQAGPVVVPNPNGPGTINAPYPSPLIYVAGVLQTSGYTVSSSGLVTFTPAPTSGAALTWTGCYYWPCNFSEDTVELAKIMGGLWSAGSIKFETRIF